MSVDFWNSSTIYEYIFFISSEETTSDQDKILNNPECSFDYLAIDWEVI